jgi:hypothetical protein
VNEIHSAVNMYHDVIVHIPHSCYNYHCIFGQSVVSNIPGKPFHMLESQPVPMALITFKLESSLT